MTSAVDICNMALSEIRSKGINSFNEASLQAEQCKLKYAHLRDQLLREAPWQFAHKIEILALTTEDIFNWAYAYTYPIDCISINRLILNIEEIESGGSSAVSRRIHPDLRQINFNQQVKYQILNQGGTKLILSNETELRVDYRARITDVNIFDSQFTQALVYLMASALAVPIVGAELGMKLRQQNYQIYQQQLASALASDLNEQHHPTPESDYVDVRN